MDIPTQRLHNQRIATAPFERAADGVRWLGAVQAQDYYGAIWSLGLRMQDAVDDRIEQAFNRGEILRTHLLRPTWHFVVPEDITWMLELTAPRVHTANSTAYRQLEIDDDTTQAAVRLIARALQGGDHMTRDELRVILQDNGIDVEERRRMMYFMMRAELDGVVCSGPRRGKQFTYALLEERAPDARSMDYEDALAELTRRYIHSHGPATEYDYAKWSGLTVTQARLGLQSIAGEIAQENIDGSTYWFADTGTIENLASPQVHLLSIYDEYISGYKDYRDIISEEDGKTMWALGNALQYIIVIDGRIAGTWRRDMGRNEITIEFNPFSSLSEAERGALETAAERYGAFFQKPVVLG